MKENIKEKDRYKGESWRKGYQTGIAEYKQELLEKIRAKVKNSDIYDGNAKWILLEDVLSLIEKDKEE